MIDQCQAERKCLYQVIKFRSLGILAASYAEAHASNRRPHDDGRRSTILYGWQHLGTMLALQQQFSAKRFPYQQLCCVGAGANGAGKGEARREAAVGSKF